MNRYITFLRGINIGGKNNIKMSELKIMFEENGFLDIVTYINSGNVIFSSKLKDKDLLRSLIEKAIKTYFKLEVPVCIIEKNELIDFLSKAPKWWDPNHKAYYHTGVFIIGNTTPSEVLEVMGQVDIKLEKVQESKKAFYWSTNLSTFKKSKLSKIASTSINKFVTIRTANTLIKIASILNREIKSTEGH